MGLTHGVKRSTLANANEKRDWRIYADFAQVLIQQARQVCQVDEDLAIELDNVVYALDATTIELCLDVFWWAKFRKHKAAIKLHTLLDVKCEIPCFVHITDGSVHDVNVLDILEFEAEAFYVMDRGYLDWQRLYQIHQSGAYFVIRAKKNLAFARVYSEQVDKTTGSCHSREAFMDPLKPGPQGINKLEHPGCGLSVQARCWFSLVRVFVAG